MAADIRAAIAQDRLDEAAAALAALLGTSDRELASEVIAHQAALRSTATKLRRGTVDDDDAERALARIRYALLAIVDEVETRGLVSGEAAAGPRTAHSVSDPVASAAARSGAAASASATPAKPSVFLSYNHDDAATAARIRAALEAASVAVHIDGDAMAPGEDIGAFIARSVRNTDATVCIVSNRSLASSWVAVETVQAFDAERGGAGRRFIACYLDDDFFRPEYRLDRTREIDARIAAIEGLLPEYAAAKLDTDDLNREKSRLYALRNDLGRILARLKESLTLDVRGDRFEPAMQRLVASLTDRRPRAEPPTPG